MRRIITIATALAFAASSLALAPSANAAGGTIAGDGSSFQYNFTTKCASRYNATNTSDDSVSYTKSSSTTGKASFASGSVQFAGTDSAFTNSYSDGWALVPIAGAAVGIAYNVPGAKNKKLRLTGPVLAYIFAHTDGTLYWDDARIKKLNKAARLPHQPIVNVHRASGSGTTQNVQTYLQAVSANTSAAAGSWIANNSGKDWAGAANGSYSVEKSNSTLLANYIQNHRYTIGYADLSDVLDNNLRFAYLRNAKGQYVRPSSAAAVKFLVKQSAPSGNHDPVTINFTKKVSGAYQLSIFTYIVIPTTTSTGKDADQVAAVKRFARYAVVTCGGRASGWGYTSLKYGKSKAIYNLALRRITATS